MSNTVDEKMVALGYAGEWLGAGNAYVIRREKGITGLREHFALEVGKAIKEDDEEFPSIVRDVTVSNLDCDDLPTSLEERVVVEITDGEGEEILPFETTLKKVLAFVFQGSAS